MKKLYNTIKSYWFKLPQQLRFIIVGGFNTVTAYLLFVFFIKVIALPYQLAIIVQFFLSVNLSIFSMKHCVFCSHNSIKQEYLKAWNVYLLMLVANYLFLWITTDILHFNILYSQAVFTVLSTILTYLLHRFYSFRN